MPLILDQIHTYWLVLDANGDAVTGLTAADFETQLFRDTAIATEAVTVDEIGSGTYAFGFQPLLAGTYGLSVRELDTFPLSIESGFAGRTWPVMPAGSATTQPYANGDRIYTYWRVFDSNENVVVGLDEADFQIVLARDASLAGESVVVDEMGDGTYAFSFTPTLTGIYGLSVQERTNTFPLSQGLGFTGREWAVTAVPVYVGTAGPDFTTLARFKARFGLSAATSNDDPIISALIPDVTAAIQGYCGRRFLAGTYTHYFDGAGLDSIALAETPATSITSVHVSTGAPRLYDASTILSPDSYIADLASGCIGRIDGNVFPAGPRTVKVVSVAGYTTIPADLEGAAQEILAMKFEKSSARLYHVQSANRGDGSVQFETQTLNWSDIPAHTREVLDRYRYYGSAVFGSVAA